MYLNYANSPYETPQGNVNKQVSLEINSCGTYRLHTKAELPTGRNFGRLDYQLIYVASGKGYFYFNSTVPTEISAGNMVFYHPNESQHYVFYGKDRPNVYWIHFTGADIDTLFENFGIPYGTNIIHADTHQNYIDIFKKIIWELQSQKLYFQESTATYFLQLLIMLGRYNHKNILDAKRVSSDEIEQASSYFYEHYNENINVEEYVESLCLSTSSFFRKFKLYTGLTPLQYILDIRLSQAKNLLESTDYSINEIALIVGYDNALYFSRLFHKHIGYSPKEYRKNIKK